MNKQIFLLFFLCCNFIFSQYEISIKATVLDQKTSKPISLANVNFGYTLQDEMLDKYNIGSIRVYGIINNASLLYSARQGYDPRLNSLGSSSGEYGANRTMSIGVNINLK